MRAINMSVSRKLLVILIIPMLGVVWFGAMRVIDGVEQASVAQQIVKDAGFAAIQSIIKVPTKWKLTH